MADMTTIKGKIKDTIYPNGTGAITAEKHQSLLLDVVDNINEVKQDVLVSGQNIRPLVSGESLLGREALGVLGTKFIYDLDNQQLFAMIDGVQQDFHIWMANRAVHSQVAQVIEIQKEGYFQELVPLTIKNVAGSATLCWEYDGMIYEASMEDNVLTVVSKPKGDEFDKQGNYPSLHVGTADDLAGRGESVHASFGFRASGGKSIKDGRAYIKAIKGNSVVWNQLYPTGWNATKEGITITSQNNIITANGTLTTTYFSNKLFEGNEVNHKYLFIVEGLSSAFNGATFSLLNRMVGAKATISNGFSYIFHVNSDPSLGCNIGFSGLTSGTVISETYIFRQIDLTKMFRAGNEPTTIEEYYRRKPIVEDEYAYNEGQVIHCNTESIKSVGDNAWDEEWEVGLIDYNNGELTDSAKNIRSKNFIKVLPNVTYSITCPQKMTVCLYDADKNYIGYVGGQTSFTTNNVYYIRFYAYEAYGTTYNHDIMITLVHSGWKQDTDAGYQPYWQDTLPLPIIRKYFPDGMKSAGSAHDEIRFNKASGKWEYSKGRLKSVDLGTFNWTKSGVYENSFYTLIEDANFANNKVCSRYVSGSLGEEKTCILAKNGDVLQLFITDSAYSDAASFKAAMQGVILYYESNDWEWVELDAEDQNFRDYYNVADFGTEEAIPATDAEGNIIPSAPFSADIIYQFNAVDMIREHEIEITELQSIIATMQAQLTSLTNGGQ